MKSDVVRVDAGLVDLARDAGEVMGRSVSAQISHWARLGRAVENSGVSAIAVQGALKGQRDFDALDPDDQAAVVGLWEREMVESIERLDLASVFEAQGQSYAELDDDGSVRVLNPGVVEGA